MSEKTKLSYVVIPDPFPYLPITTLGVLEDVPSGELSNVYCRPIPFAEKIHWSITMDLAPLISLSEFRYMLPETGTFVKGDIVANFLGATFKEENDAKRCFYEYHSGLEIKDRFILKEALFEITKVSYPLTSCRLIGGIGESISSISISALIQAKQALESGKEIPGLEFIGKVS